MVALQSLFVTKVF
uniref:Uncharacterized protein n=1 Tax=Arundo donax TaxID=35708 RepID=A0A0A9BF44_ARUDO